MEKLTVGAITDKAEMLQAATAQLLDLGLSYSLNLLSAIMLLIAGLWLAKHASNWVKSRLQTIEKIDATLVPIVAQVLRYIVLIFTVILVLAEFGIQTTSIIAVLGAAGLAIGLALQGTLQNVAAGIMLLVIRPFRVGDFIEAGSTKGTVDEIGLFMTQLHTAQNLYLAVPNSTLWSNVIINYSMHPRRRLDFVIGISYDDDIDQAIELIRTQLLEDARIDKDPAPLIGVTALGESSVDLEIRVWTKIENYRQLHCDLLRILKYNLDEAGISIPYPHRQIVMSHKAEGALPPKKVA